MYRLVVLSVLAVTAVFADLEMRDCARMFHPHSMNCCKKPLDIKDKMFSEDDLKECMQLPKDPVKCEHEVCLAKKKGLATDDGKLDLVKFEEMVTNGVDDKDLLEDLKTNCINGDLSKYGPPDFCDFMKIRHCSAMQILNHCTEWNDFADCSKLKAAAGECVKLFA